MSNRKKKQYLSKPDNSQKENEPVKEKELLAPEVEKRYFDIFNYQRKQRNNLLGRFVGGEYKITEEIVKELLAVPKKFDNFDNNIAYASVKLNTFVLNFKVEFDISPSFCKAKLFIIEIEQTFEEDNKLTTLLAEVLEDYNFEFREKIFEQWHIFYDDNTTEKKGFLYEYLHLQNEEFLFNGEITELLSQLFVLRMLQLLSSLGESGELTKTQFNELMAKMLAKDPSFATNFTLQKMLLDGLIMKNGLMPSILALQEGKKILDAYAKPLENIRDKTYPILLEEMQTQKEDNSKEKAKPKEKAKTAPAKAKKSSSATKAPETPKAKPAAKKEEKKEEEKEVVVDISKDLRKDAKNANKEEKEKPKEESKKEDTRKTGITPEKSEEETLKKQAEELNIDIGAMNSLFENLSDTPQVENQTENLFNTFNNGAGSSMNIDANTLSEAAVEVNETEPLVKDASESLNAKTSAKVDGPELGLG